MGNWHISIEGIGSHHNTDNPKDADKMAAEFVKQLKAVHNVTKATFTYGAAQSLEQK